MQDKPKDDWLHLQVISWNIHGWYDSKQRSNGNQLAQFLLAMNESSSSGTSATTPLRVLALQEVKHPHSRWFATDLTIGEDAKVNELDLLASRLKMSYVFFNPGMGFGGNAILFPDEQQQCTVSARYQHPIVVESCGDDRALVGIKLLLPRYQPSF